MSAWINDKSKLWKGWSDWLILEPAKIKALPNTDGAYVIRIRRGERGPAPGLPRLLGVDPHAVLDIGQSKSLRTRLLSFERCATQDRITGHMAGWRYRHLRLHKRVPGRLEFAFAKGRRSYGMEADLMGAYLDTFGELPPLNYKANWDRYKDD